MPHGLSEFAEIALPVAVHGTFTYSVPEELRDGVRLGSRVEVPLGTKRTTGFVVGLSDQPPQDGTKLKSVRTLLDDDEPALIPEIIELCRWASDYYLAPLGEMLRVALPANLAARGRREAVFTATEEMLAQALEEKRVIDGDVEILRELQKRPLPLSFLFEEK